MELLTFITPLHLALIPITVGLVEVVKRTRLFNKRYTPVSALVIGIGLASCLGGGVNAVVIGGIVIALAACGLYSGSATLKN